MLTTLERLGRYLNCYSSNIVISPPLRSGFFIYAEPKDNTDCDGRITWHKRRTQWCHCDLFWVVVLSMKTLQLKLNPLHFLFPSFSHSLLFVPTVSERLRNFLLGERRGRRQQGEGNGKEYSFSWRVWGQLCQARGVFFLSLSPRFLKLNRALTVVTRSKVPHRSLSGNPLKYGLLGYTKKNTNSNSVSYTCSQGRSNEIWRHSLVQYHIWIYMC